MPDWKRKNPEETEPVKDEVKVPEAEPEYHPDEDSEDLGDEDAAFHTAEAERNSGTEETDVLEEYVTSPHEDEAKALGNVTEVDGSDTEPVKTVTVAPAGEPVELDPNFQLTPKEPAKPNELKIMITLTGDSTVIGLRREGCDPVFYYRPDGGLDKAMESLKSNIQFADGLWAKSPRYPKAVIPTPPAPTPARASAPVTVNTKPVAKPPPPPTKPKIQPSMF